MSGLANKNMHFQKQGEGEKSFFSVVVKPLKAISCHCQISKQDCSFLLQPIPYVQRRIFFFS